jgi:hypothetical protein
MDIRRIFEATWESIIADFSKLDLSADMSESLLPLFEIISVFVFSTWSSSSLDFTLSIENWSIAGLFEPRRMYLLRLSVDCKEESFCIVHTALAGKLYLHALLNETALFGSAFAVFLLKFGAHVALITVMV